MRPKSEKCAPKSYMKDVKATESAESAESSEIEMNEGKTKQTLKQYCEENPSSKYCAPE